MTTLLYIIGSLNILINSTLANMSASARTDDDSSVTVATLESIELVLKALKGRDFLLDEKVVSSLLVTIEDVLYSKVCGCGLPYMF